MMSRYGNLRRRELRALPTYQYPQQYFVLAQPDILTQAGYYPEEQEHKANGYGMPAWLMPIMSWGVKTGSDLQSAARQRELATVQAEAQAIANAETSKHAAIAAAAFNKRLPLILLSLLGIGIVGTALVIRLRG